MAEAIRCKAPQGAYQPGSRYRGSRCPSWAHPRATFGVSRRPPVGVNQDSPDPAGQALPLLDFQDDDLGMALGSHAYGPLDIRDSRLRRKKE